MPQKAPIGGSNRCIVWGLASPYTAPTTITGITSGAMIFDKSETSTITGDVRTNNLTLELASKIRNNEYVLFKAHSAVNATITPTVFTYEDGEEDTVTNVPTAAIGKRLVIAHIDGTDGTNRIVTVFCGLLDGTALGSSRSSGSLGDTNIKFVAVPAPTTISIPTTFWAGLTPAIIAATAITLPGGSYGTEFFVAAT